MMENMENPMTRDLEISDFSIFHELLLLNIIQLYKCRRYDRIETVIY